MSRESILRAIRGNRPAFASGLTVNGKPDIYPVSDFSSAVAKAGGTVIECAASEVEGIIADRFGGAFDFTNASTREQFSAFGLTDPEGIRFAVFEGRIGVTENGAVWIEDEDLPMRILPFIAHHLVFKLRASRIVPTIDDAYSLIHLDGTGYGVFISGPSKTADIEQSLVYGAHGAVELTILLIRD
ncbi:MAG: LUD domain-containing protein [Dysgonamonadaceae bacterium]|jgi:L-lactate dehydrogenase complex protein LldG|nr:LUD domain-containing protein [Dysgonamonadaceae bacterium]